MNFSPGPVAHVHVLGAPHLVPLARAEAGGAAEVVADQLGVWRGGGRGEGKEGRGGGRGDSRVCQWNRLRNFRAKFGF